ncbi:MAG: hypothetical protein P1S60_03380 [Anaerolineae bacterium]|nr:hypothetical protein [Anaerolineae bacterium]
MSSQLLALSIAFVGAVALSLYGILRKSLLKRNATDTRELPSQYDHLSNEVGRVAEEGKAIHVALGNGGLTGNDAVTSLAALRGLNTLIDLSAAYDTPPLITTGDPTLYLLADNRLRKAYARLGNISLYQPQAVQFASQTPASFAAVAAQQILRNKIGTNIMLGAYDQEISLVSDAAARQNIKSYGGSTSPLGLAALFLALDSDTLIIGEQMFDAVSDGVSDGVYSARAASLWTQDLLRWLVIASIAGLAIVNLASSILGGT